MINKILITLFLVRKYHIIHKLVVVSETKFYLLAGDMYYWWAQHTQGAKPTSQTYSQLRPFNR